jgi:hypothetical protein
MRLTSIAGALVLATVATSVAPAQGLKTNASGNLIIKSVQLKGVNLDAATGIITATGTVTGTLAGAPFSTTIDGLTITPLVGDPSGACSVLDLHLAPISIRLLGLHVDTSAICLSITAIPGGGLLGDLLCGLTDGGLPLNLLGSFLEDLLGEILTPALQQAQPPQSGGDSVCTGTCEILDLVLGPLDLTLLGLNVHLDNCDNGPVEVCVSATASEGLLGQLLCGLTGSDLLNITLQDIAKLVKRLTKGL